MINWQSQIQNRIIQLNRWLLVCLLLLSTTVGCKTTSPQSRTSPQATSSASVAPSAVGWKKIQGKGVELSVPETYEGGNPSKKEDLDAIANKLKAIDPEYQKRIESLKQNPSSLALVAFDTQKNQPKFVTNVNIATDKATEGDTVEQYLAASVKDLSGSFKVVDQKVVSLEKYQAGRIVAETTAAGTPIKLLFYIIKNGNSFWLVTYSTAANEFEQQLPNFEKSIRTFALPS